MDLTVSVEGKLAWHPRMFFCRTLQSCQFTYAAIWIRRDVTFQNLGDGKLIDLLELQVPQKRHVDASKPVESISTLRKLKKFRKVSRRKLGLEPLKLSESNVASPTAMIKFVGGKEDTGLQIQIKDLSPSLQISLIGLSWHSKLGDFVAENLNLLGQGFLLFLLDLVQRQDIALD